MVVDKKAVDKKAEEWLYVEQSRELFIDIRGRGGASNPCFHSFSQILFGAEIFRLTQLFRVVINVETESRALGESCVRRQISAPCK